MAHLRNLPEPARLGDLFRAFPDAAEPLLYLHEAVLRSDCQLSVADRETIAAYVSGLNACTYCYGSHAAAAAYHGVDEGLLTQIIDDVDTAPVRDAMKPMLRLARKVTLSPAKVTRGDVDACYDAGWDDRAIFNAVATAALFNFMNRLVDGTGMATDPQFASGAGARIGESYLGFMKQIGLSED
jgi:uncharacterized peroxidase-related enzyme